MQQQTITIGDVQSGASATILASYGFNCYSFRASFGGDSQEVLWAMNGFESGTLKPSASGIPILFPYPGRLRGDHLEYQGRRYPQEVFDPHGNAIHGFVLRRAWRVIDQAADRVTGEFQASVDDPSLLERWPADFRIRVTHVVAGNSLTTSFELDNPSDRQLPFGLGAHPYFRVPLGPKGSAGDCVVRAPVGAWWPLEQLLPTGDCRPATDRTTLADGIAFSETQLDDVFGELTATPGPDGKQHVVATIEDAANGRRLTVSYDAAFAHCVLFNPPHREAICIEPYSCVPDTYNLTERGISAGLLTLAPGEKFSASMRVALEAVADR